MRISLRVDEGPHEGKVFAFEGHSNFIVGRSDRAHFRLPAKDKFFSRIHFMIEVNPPLCRLTDMGSTNGTLVNGKKVGTADLKDGDTIKAGLTVLRVAVAEAPESAEAEAEPWPSPETISIRRDRLAPGGDEERTLPGPPPRPATMAHADVCRVCAAPLLGRSVAADTVGLCPACQDDIRGRPQPIAGYRIVRELGRGGMGVVCLALRDADGSLVALKTIRPAVAGSEAEVRRFLREAEILSQLDHPHIVRFRENGASGDQLHFAMDYVSGCDAARLQQQHGGPLPVARAADLACQMLSALAYAHALKFVHRDIKPANLLVTSRNGRDLVLMSDFGLARVYQASKLSGLTMNGDLGGTIAFMAPEQITELRDARPAVDQYSAAATLYKFLTNRYIHDLTGRLEQQISRILLDDPVPIRTRNPELPEDLAAIVHKALAREPADRFADVTAFRRALLPFTA